MSGAVTTAVIASAVIGAGASIYASEQQKKATESATRAQEEARRKAEEEARRVALETKPDELNATLDVGGSTHVGGKTQSTADFLVPRQSTLGSTGKSGLGFKV